MADKVLRFTAEDSGYGQTIDRMAAKLRGAFSNSGMSDILQEADAKFTNFGDKLKFIRNELNSIKEGNLVDRDEAIKAATDANDKAGRPRSNDFIQRQASKQAEGEEKVINRLISSLDSLGNKVEEANSHTVEESGKPPIVPPTEPPKEEPSEGGGVFGGGVGGFIGNALSNAVGFGIERLGERVLGYLSDKIGEGINLARRELTIGRQFVLPEDTLNDAGGRTKSPYELGINNKEFLEAIANTAGSRRNATGVVDETIARLRLTSAYGVDNNQFGALDKFYRRRNDGSMLDASGMDASRTIIEILSRADKQGILGVSKGDFTMLPEKIGQVTALMGQQYASTERTNAGSAIGIMLAGNRIGGRFGDDRAADTFGRLNEGITNPNNPGMKAYIYEVLRRANPGQSPLQLEGLMQEGLSNPKNSQAIFGGIQNVRSREMRGRILQSLGLDAQSAYRLAGSENLQAFTGGLGAHGLSATEYAQQQAGIKERGEQLTLGTDKAMSYFSNSVTSFGDAVTKFVNGVKVPAGPNAGTPTTTAPKTNTNKVIPATPHH
jgi:hypothetical protein